LLELVLVPLDHRHFLAHAVYLPQVHGHDRSAPAACAWLLFPLAPVLLFSLFPANDMAHDRYLYIPSIGVALFLAIALRVLVPSPVDSPPFPLPLSAASH